MQNIFKKLLFFSILSISFPNAYSATTRVEISPSGTIEENLRQTNLNPRQTNLSKYYKETCTGQISYNKITLAVGMFLIVPIGGLVITYYAQLIAATITATVGAGGAAVVAAVGLRGSAAAGAAVGGPGGAAVGAAGGIITVGGIVTGAYLEIIRKGHTGWFTVSLEDGLETVHTQLKKDSEVLITGYPDSIRNAIDSLDTDISSLLNNNEGELALKCLKRREEVLLGLPTQNQIRNIDLSRSRYSVSTTTRQRMQQNIQDLIDKYPEDNKQPLKLLVQKMRDNSIQPEGKANRVQAYIHGRVGTGKTEFVRALGAALDLHVCHLKFSTLELEDLLGVEIRDEKCKIDNKKVIGKLGQCFIDAGSLNPIVFFDDVGTYLKDNFPEGTSKYKLQQRFKELLSKSKKSLGLGGLGLSIDTSRATYIVESSEKPSISDQEYSTILKNFDIIEFADFTRNEKRRAIEYIIEKYLNDYNSILNKKTRDNLRWHASKLKEFILEEDAELNNPGASMIQDVVEYLLGIIRLEITERNHLIPVDDEEALALFKSIIKKRFQKLAGNQA